MTVLLAAVASSSGHVPPVVLLIAFLVGLLLFILGFRTYRQYRIMADTPEAKVRSLAMGLVHLFGKAIGEDRLVSPLTGVPCFYYRVEVQKWVKKDPDKAGEWENVRTDSEERKFCLDDGTGKVLVDPHNAEYDVTRTFHGEIGPESSRRRHVDPTLGVPGPSDQDLRAYLTDYSRARAAIAASNLPGAKVADKALAVGQALGSMGVSIGGGGLSFELGGSQSYRFTEHCLVADRDCNILGTCAENPAPKDESDRNIIRKGQNEKTFLITTKTEKQIEKSLRWKAFVLIVVGAAVMVGVVALALHQAGSL